MLEALGAGALALGVVVLSIFLLGLGTLLKRGRCSLRGCGGERAGDACDACPSAGRSEPQPPLEV